VGVITLPIFRHPGLAPPFFPKESAM